LEDPWLPPPSKCSIKTFQLVAPVAPVTPAEKKAMFEAAVLRKENRELRRLLRTILTEITKALEVAMKKTTPKELPR